ncbi:hypothetical protein INS49_001999 [Diaporthe citri]|uniref:uncharacterized protein n=1 Tax=Diaporthe citri TaxID=83186 RepID=UPI001C822FB3|nr:uncharacterized protein INS49_001999 [Diaporthe citri]KAG6367804.1 hypothetical protein INS49_001999 [Diaporthe citri]
MARNDDEKDGLASQPGSKTKIGRKHLNVPKPIVIPESCKITPDGSLASPWMRLGHDVGLNLTAPRTPEQEYDQRAPKPTGQLKEDASAEIEAGSCQEEGPIIQAKEGSLISLYYIHPKEVQEVMDHALKSHSQQRAPRRHQLLVQNSDTRNQDRSRSSSHLEDADLEDEYRPEYSNAEEAYQYGARDDDADDEYTTIYDGDDQGAEMRRFRVMNNPNFR